MLELKKGDTDKAHVVGVQWDKRDMTTLLNTPVKDVHGCLNFAMLAIPRPPDEFLACATKLVHPVLQRMRVGTALEDSIRIHNDGLKLRKQRLNKFVKAVSMARLCDGEKVDLHNKMDSELKKFFAWKKGPSCSVASKTRCFVP